MSDQEKTKLDVGVAGDVAAVMDEGEGGGGYEMNRDVSREQEELAAENGSLQTEESVLDDDDDNNEVEEEEEEEDNVIIAITHEDMEAEAEVEAEEGAVRNKSGMDNDQWLRYLDETDPSHRLRSFCKRGDLEALKEFLASPLSAKANVDAQCKDGWTSLHEIITHECQFTEVARLLVEEGGASVNTRDANGDSPLHSALLYHNADNIRLLLRAGADQSVMNNAGRMPVHVADDADSLAILLQDGAGNIANLRDLEGNSPLHYAVCRKDKDRSWSTPKDRDRVALLLKHSADINIQNHNGSTPLHLTPDAEIAEMLLEAGADPNLADSVAANTPLHLAVKGRHKDIVRLMLKKGADLNLANQQGKTPLNLAKDKEMKNILLGKDSGLSANQSCPAGASSSAPPSSASQPGGGAKRKRGLDAAHLEEMASLVAPACTSPSILKRRRVSVSAVGSAGESTEEESQSPPSSKPRVGPRLRFSDVNDYSGVEVVEDVRRVKAMPIYSEPTFSSDEEGIQ